MEQNPKKLPVILVVEDDHFLQEMYSDVFARNGFAVMQAFNGEEAVAWLDSAPQINVILVDIMLPKISGYDVIKHIRESSLKRDIPIMVVSALESEEDKRKGYDLGINEYYTKGDTRLAQIVESAKRYAADSDSI